MLLLCQTFLLWRSNSTDPKSESKCAIIICKPNIYSQEILIEKLIFYLFFSFKWPLNGLVYKLCRKAQITLDCLIFSWKCLFFSLNYTTKFKWNCLKKPWTGISKNLNARSRHSVFSESEKTSGVSVLKTYFTAELNGEVYI